MPLTSTKLLLITLSVALAPAAAGSTWYVNGKNGKDTNNCTTSTLACKTIGHAIGLAASGDSISIAAATYTENLLINVNLKLTGASAATTIIDGGQTSRVISIENTAISVTLSRLTIRHGVAAGGGGILNWGKLTISSSAITSNYAASTYSDAGGGIYNSGTLTINNSTLSGNSASSVQAYGGAIYNSGTTTINNSTFSGNAQSASNGFGGGGAIYNGGTLKISSSTFSGNSGIPSGGGIYNGGTATLQNTIIANSPSGGNCSGTIASNGYNLSTDATCNFSGAGDLNDTNPNLGPLQNNGGQTFTMALPSGSPAIDAGNPAGCTDNLGHLLRTDQRGQPRHDPEDTTGCDIGSYESQTD
jgi:hypothetical protein